MYSVSTIIVLGLLFGVLQLAAGVIIGRSLPVVRRRFRRDKPIDTGRVQRYGRRLRLLAHSVADDVGRYQNEIQQACRDLTAAQGSPGASVSEAVLQTVGQLMKTNENLQQRLSAAEGRLQQQSQEIESHFNDARTDALTELPNRRAFDDVLSRRIAEWQRRQTPFSLVMADMDRFKALNDRYGHPAGDAVLRHTAEILQVTVRDMDMVARVGGEELAVILPATDAQAARRVAERIRAAVAGTSVPFEEIDLCVTVSLGVATVVDGDDPASLLRRADEALYVAKRSGRNCAYFHDGGRPERIMAERRLADPLQAEDEWSELCSDLRGRLGEVIESDRT